MVVLRYDTRNNVMDILDTAFVAHAVFDSTRQRITHFRNSSLSAAQWLEVLGIIAISTASGRTHGSASTSAVSYFLAEVSSLWQAARGGTTDSRRETLSDTAKRQSPTNACGFRHGPGRRDAEHMPKCSRTAASAVVGRRIWLVLMAIKNWLPQSPFSRARRQGSGDQFAHSSLRQRHRAFHRGSRFPQRDWRIQRPRTVHGIRLNGRGKVALARYQHNNNADNKPRQLVM